MYGHTRLIMRFKAKHQNFKDLAGRLDNFKKIAKTLASRHQRYLCYNLLNTHQFAALGTDGTKEVGKCDYIIKRYFCLGLQNLSFYAGEPVDLELDKSQPLVDIYMLATHAKTIHRYYGTIIINHH